MSRETTAELVAAQHTLAYLQPNLQPQGRVLEVGCGDGLLASLLVERGCEVVAIEPSAEAAERARGRGVEVCQQELSDVKFPNATFDAILFGRSMHHIHHLEEDLEHVRRWVVPGGQLICEEFDVEHVDPATAAWFYERRLRLLPDQALPGTAEATPLERWVDEHEHDPPLHSGAVMLAATARHFAVEQQQRGPYLFRYFGSRLSQDAAGWQCTQQLLEEETSAIEAGQILPVGLRWVASLRSPL